MIFELLMQLSNPWGPAAWTPIPFSHTSKNWPTVVLDLKDCFYTIPFAPQDKREICILVPSISKKLPWNGTNKKCCLRKWWIVLCYVWLALLVPLSSSLHLSLYGWHNLSCPRVVSPKPTFSPSSAWPYMMGTTCSPWKIQKQLLFLFRLLGFKSSTITPQKVSIRYNNLKALNDSLKLLGDISGCTLLWASISVHLNNSLRLLKGTQPLSS